MEKSLNKILEDCRKDTLSGQVANYIPELAKANREDIGVYVAMEGEAYYAGDWEKEFSIQSICKPILLLLATMDNGIDFVKAHMGVEATGKPFNAIDYAEPLLLREHINPMVNIGAIAVCGMIKASSVEERLKRLIEFTQKITGNPNIEVDQNVFQSEWETGNKNRALAYLLKNSGMIYGKVDDILEVYFSICSIKINCKDLANMGLLLAHHGKEWKSGEQIIPEEDARFLNAILTTSGMYDGSGEFATTVGIPAKSGVGGGIMANCPGRMGIGIYSPGLDKKGNSVAGIKMLERLSNELELSIF
ncbi:glutaminase [Clostridiales Family XIII bacterium PM5-7]